MMALGTMMTFGTRTDGAATRSTGNDEDRRGASLEERPPRTRWRVARPIHLDHLYLDLGPWLDLEQPAMKPDASFVGAFSVVLIWFVVLMVSYTVCYLILSIVERPVCSEYLLKVVVLTYLISDSQLSSSPPPLLSKYK